MPPRGGDVNLHAYVANNPINLSDPTGEVIPVVVAGILIVGAGGWSATIAELVEVYKGSSP
ncbi:MAG: hypothetical protein L0191_12440 [Acidobacteria bacterium]|nr:hypothetical protein [Acidobacteriota bacterium]